MKRELIRLLFFACVTLFMSLQGVSCAKSRVNAQPLISEVCVSSSSEVPHKYVNAFESADTASWAGYQKPKTVKLNKLKGAKLQGLDFVLNKHLRDMYGYSIINPERPRYGLYEFDDVEHMRINKNDTLYAIIAAPGWLLNTWKPRYYMFWTRNDTVAKDSRNGNPVNYRMDRRTSEKRRIKRTGYSVIYSMGALKDCLSTRLHAVDSLDALPPRYWAPLEDMEGDPNKYITFAIKMIFKDGIVSQAWVTKFYNGGVNEIVR